MKLGSLGDFRTGGTPTRTRPEYFEGEIPWITTTSLGKPLIDESDAVEYISMEAIENSSTKLISPNSIMVGIRVGVGKVSINLVPMCTSQDIISIENINEEIVYKPFLVYCIKSYKNYFSSHKRGATIQGISSAVLKSINIPLPPLETQKQIAKTLDTAAELLAMRKQQLAELDNLIKSIFYDMFGSESDFNRWECTTIENVAKVTVGVVIKPAQYYTQGPNGVKAFRSLNVGEMYVREESWVYFTPEGHLVHNKSVLKTGDVLIVRSGAPGTSCVVSEKYAGCNAIDIIIARPDINKIKPLYLCAFTNFPHGKNQIKMKTGGAAQQHINVGAYKAMTIPLPPLELQTQFADIVTKIEEQKALVKKAIDETQYLFDSLMSQYFE
nr:restriction endonuclease subunit S [Brevibacillus borstelensis]